MHSPKNEQVILRIKIEYPLCRVAALEEIHQTIFHIENGYRRASYHC